MKELFDYSYSIAPTDWSKLPESMKIEKVLNTVNKLYFPYTQLLWVPDGDLGEDEEKTFKTYMEFANYTADTVGLDGLNPLSMFWNTSSLGGYGKRFTERVKEIVWTILMDIGYNPLDIEWFRGDNIYFSSHKSRHVYLIDNKFERYGCNIRYVIGDKMTQWDSWKLGFIDMMVKIMDKVVDITNKNKLPF